VAEERTRERFELCCIPFFPYGMALGDLVSWDDSAHRAQVAVPSGRRTVRVAFAGPKETDRYHDRVYGELAEAGFLIEFNSPGYGAVDVASAEQFDLAPRLLNPYVEQNILSWEWATSMPGVEP